MNLTVYDIITIVILRGLIAMFGERLKLLRKEKLWTIDDVSEKLKIGRSTYAGYETEHRKPPIETLIKLSSLYNVSVDYIIGITDERGIKKAESNVRELLNKADLHYEGVPLSDEELRPIRDILEVVVRDRLPMRLKNHYNK